MATTTKKKNFIQTFQKSEMMPLWIAYNIDPKCGAPKEARIREDGVTYKGNVLCMGTAKQPVAKFVKLRKQLVLIYNADTVWTRRGWNQERIDIEIKQHRNPDMITWAGDHKLTITFADLHKRLWGKYPHFNTYRKEVSKILHIAKLAGYSQKKLKTPPKVDLAVYEYTPDALYFGRRKSTERAKEIIRYYTPEAKAERAAAAKEEAFQHTTGVRRHNVLESFMNTCVIANNDVNKFRNAANLCSMEMLMAYLGHTPGRDDLYKRVGHVDAHHGLERRSNSNNFAWPALGDWAPDVLGAILACNNGYHLTDLKHIDNWSNWGNHLYLAEGRGDVHADMNKIAFRSARLVKYIGEITQENQIAAYYKATGTDLAKEYDDAVARQAIAQGELAMARAGYADCLAEKGKAEQDYVRFKIGENLDGQMLLGTEQGP